MDLSSPSRSMPFRANERLLTLVLTICFVTTVVLLAYLQYRWSSEVSAAATTRMRSNLESSTMGFRQDLSSQLGVLCLELQSESGEETVDARRLAQRLEHWKRTSAFPDLVSDIYVSRTTQAPRLSRLVAEDARFEETDWPSALQEFSQRLRHAPPPPGSDHPYRGHHPRDGHPGPPRDRLQMGAIDETVPAVIFPAAPNSRELLLLVELNQDVIDEKLLPQLATRYFGSTATSDFTVVILRNHDGQAQTVYSSESVPTADFENSADASVNLFGPPLGVGSAARFALGLFRPEPAPPPQSNPTFSTSGVGVPVPMRFESIRHGETDPNWRVVVKHRKGSVAAAVAALRRRNLAVSFLVLLIMAGSMGLIVYNSYRSRRLARLQMDFVAGVSHELRTPVAAILSISDNIASGAISDRGKITQYGELIRKQARQLNQLVEQVLNFSAASKRNESTTRTVSVSEAIDQALESTAPLIAEASVDIHCNVASNTPSAYGDAVRLSQCLQNLITNAIKYGGDGKSISIDARAVQNGSSSRKVEIAVADQGIGIRPEDLPHIFEPFYRSPEVMESAIHGTGLGLSVTKGYVESMGGEISATSKPGAGSTFTIRLTAADEASKQVPAQVIGEA